jgi:hypothetical protein
MLLGLLLSGCVWDVKEESNSIGIAIETDRTVYEELSQDDLISIVSSAWPRGVSNYCLEVADKITVELSADLKTDCGSAWPCDACIYVRELRIIVDDDGALLDEYESIAHELIHFFAHCADKNSDGTHIVPKYWASIDPENSVEAVVSEIIWKETRALDED